MITSTRTHTRYFDKDLLDAIGQLALQMDAEWESRTAWLPEAVRQHGDVRISALMAAIFLCGEDAS